MSGYPKATAVTGFTFLMVSSSDGTAITGGAGAITAYITKDGGTQTTLGGTIAEEGNGQYSVDITADEMDADIVGLLFTHASATPDSYTIATVSANDVTDTTLSLTYTDYQSEVGWLFYGKRTGLSAAQQTQIDVFLKAGQTQFYAAHDWNFLKVTQTLETVVDQEDYQFPNNCAGIIGPLSFKAGDDRWQRIELCSEYEIRQLRQLDYSGSSFTPVKAAKRFKRSDGSAAQRWELLIWPKADAAYTLRYSMRIAPNAMTSANSYPYGGYLHAETIMESCLSIAEERMDEKSGIHKQRYQELLQQSIARDTEKGPAVFGYNGDAAGNDMTLPYLLRDTLVPYEGTQYPD